MLSFLNRAITKKCFNNIVWWFLSGTNSVDDIKQLIKEGKVVDNNIISSLDDNTQVIFRNDTGNHAHQIKPKGYFDKVDHYNVEIQTKTKAGKWKSKWSFHIIFDEKGNIIDTFD